VKISWTGLFLALYWSLTSALAQTTSLLPETKNINGLMYMTGGIGSEESEAMQELGKKWPLLVELSQDHPQRALWISDVQIKLSKKGSKTPSLEIVTEGPILLIDLPPGEYTIDAVFEGRPLKRNIKIEASKSNQLNLMWPIVK